MKLPCELIIWYIFPAVRRELVKSLTKDYGFKQKEVANMIGVTDATVSQYLKSKRAKVVLSDENIIEQIEKVAKDLAEGNPTSGANICDICKSVKSSNMLDYLYEIYTDEHVPPKDLEDKCAFACDE